MEVQNITQNEVYCSLPEFNSVQVRNRQVVQQFDFPSKCFQSLQGILIPQSFGLFLIYQNKIMSQHLTTFFYSVFLSRFSIGRVELNNQRLLDTEDCIGSLVRIATNV